ncbi:MAG TPA: superinfection immunity protein [Gammaproteobacteria bacterium]|jgi:NADH:ubiquinone oxidoreductase subunit 6 (subunit J)|nr:superinfection immunity protein [Gammaproteobacteria bacterium]
MKKQLLILTLLLSASFSVFADSHIDAIAEGIIIFTLAIIAILVFFLPTIVAFKRYHRNRWIILLLNILGATVIFWFIALVWAFNKVDDPIKGGHQIDGQFGDRHL